MSLVPRRCRTRSTFGAIALVAVTTFAVAGNAAPSSVEEIANYQGPDRRSVLETGARKEGEVLVYITGAQLDPLLKAFSEKYPYIKVTPFRTESQDIARRTVEEYKVGRYTVDTFETNTGALQPLRDAGILQPYVSSETASFRQQAVEPSKLWTVDKESYVGLGYNTKIHSDAELPKTYDDLLDPKWKGKFALSSDGGTLELWTGSIILSKGEAFLRQLGKQDFKVYAIGGRGLSNLVVSGEVSISPSIYSGHMSASKASGASVDWRALGPIYANLAGVGLAKKAPHPHAGMMMVDFLLSLDGQKIYQKLGYATARTDLENWEKPESVLYLTERPNFHAEFEQWSRIVRQVFATAK